jgi:uncharacterized membrane protein YozB (DUF420 family)
MLRYVHLDRIVLGLAFIAGALLLVQFVASMSQRPGWRMVPNLQLKARLASFFFTVAGIAMIVSGFLP